MPPTILGLFAQPLPDEMRPQLGRNTGVLVWVVKNGSPAAAANILEGDVISKVNGQDVLSVPDFVDKFTKLVGQKVEVEIWRDGQFKTVSVQLNNNP
jgi:S1-C subfamily serine protease